MTRVITRIVLIAAVALLVVGVGLPLVEQNAQVVLSDEAVALEGGPDSLMEVAGRFESVDVGDEGVTLTTDSGEAYQFDLDPEAIMEKLSVPSGDTGTDVLKYSVFGGVLLRVLSMVKRLFRSLLPG